MRTLYKETYWGPNIEAYADRRVEEALAEARGVWAKERIELKRLAAEREHREARKRKMEAVKEREEKVLNFLATGKLTREEIAGCLKVPLQVVERIADCGKSR